MAGRLSGKVAIVTGASRGIGEAIAGAMAREGAKVVVTSRKQDAVEAAAQRVRDVCPEAAGAVFARACHAGDAAAIADLVAWASAEVGTVDVLVNNAATNPHFGPFLSVDAGAWAKTFEVNVLGYFEHARHVAKALLKADKPGSIVNVASMLGISAAPLQGVYGMTKAAVISMTKTLAVELGKANIRVNAIAPGLVETKFASVLVNSPDILQRYNQHTALARHAQPSEIAGMAVFLASDEASYVTGQTFPVDGGYTIA